MGEIKRQTLSGIKWSAIEKFSVQGIQFLIGLILARLLTPADFGTIGMLGVFIAISQSFIDSGFSTALIRKLDRKEIDFCTVFYFNIVVSVLCYAVLFVSAPLVSSFFDYPLLTDVLRVVAINLVINSLNAVQYARFSIAVDFKSTAKVSLITTVLSGAIGIVLAYKGLGVWSLVYQQISAAIISTVVIWTVSKWRPQLVFSWKSFHELFSYGSKLLMAGLLHTVYSNMSSLAIGKFYTPKDLGLFSKGESLVTLPCSNITGILQRVTFPIFSKIQENDEQLIGVYRKYICITSMMVFFVLTLLAALAKPVILVLLTEKWLGAVIFTQLLCFSWMFDHICAMNLNVLQVKGRSDLFLKLEIIKKTISISMLLTAIPFGMVAICVSRILYTQIAVYINTYYTGKLFGLGYGTQFGDFGGYLILAVIASAPAFLLTFTELHPLLIIMIGGTVSLLTYLSILWLRKDTSLLEVMTLTRESVLRNRNKG